VAYGETTTSGQGVGRAFSVPDRVLSQADRSILGTGKPAYGRLNGLLKQSYEISREELNNAIVGARLWSKYFPGSELPTSADSLFRTADDMTWMQERYPWLAAEFVRTPDVDRARRIWAILNDPNRTDFLAVDAEGKSYLTAIPRDVVAKAGDDLSIRDLNHQMLKEARSEYQTARLQPQRPDVASQIGGGLSKGSQDAAAKIRKAETDDLQLLVKGTEKKAQETSKYLAETIRAAYDNLGASYFDVQAMSDDLGWGPLAGLNYQQVDELRKIIDRPQPTLTDGRWSDEVIDDATPAVPAEPRGVVKRLQWKANPDGQQTFGNRMILKRNINGTYTEYFQRADQTSWQEGFTLGQGDMPNMTPEQWESEMLRRGDGDGAWATRLEPSETWTDPRVAQWGSTPDAGRAPQQAAAPEPVVTQSRGGATITDGTDTLTVQKQGSHWEVLDADGKVIGRNPGKAHAIERAKQHFAKAGRQIKDDLTNPSLGITATRRQSFGDRIAQGRQALIESADTSAALGIRNADLKWTNDRGLIPNRDATLLDKTIRGGHLAGNGTAWKVPGQNVPRHLQDAEWSVYDAMTYVKDPARLVENPKFNVDAAIQDIAIHASDLHTKDFGAFARGVDKVGKSRIVRTYDNYLNVFQRQHRRYGPLTFVRNMVGDTIGTGWQLIVKGELDTALKMNPLTLGRKTRTYRHEASDATLRVMDPHRMTLDGDAMRKGSKRDPNAMRIAESLDDPNVRGTGQLIPMKLIPGSSRGEDILGGLPSANARARALGPFQHIANLWSVPYGKDFLNTIDNVSRTSMWKQHYNRLWRDEGLKSFKKTMDELSGDPSISADWMQRIARQAQRKTGDGPWSGSFSPDDVRQALKGVTKHDTALSRAWQGQLVKASDGALKRTEDVLFTYKNTNADEIARRIFVFHYWQTRAYPLHVRAALRNPILLTSYYKMWQELEAIAERDNYPPYLNNMFRFAQTPEGISMYGNPMDLLIPMTVTDLHDEKGNKLQALAQQIAPPIVGALAGAGLVDNTVDVTGLSSTENFIRKLNNWMVAEGIDPTQLPWLGQFFDPLTLDLNLTVEEFQQAVIDRINEVFGQPLGDYQPFDRGANELDQLGTWVGSVAINGWNGHPGFGPMFDDNGELLWTDEQMTLYQDAMTGRQSGLEGNWILDGATEHFGTEDGISALLNLFMPGGGVVNSQDRADFLRIRDHSGDGDERTADAILQHSRASDPAWQIANTQYHAIGTDDQREVNDLYNDMIYEPQSFRERTVIVPDGQGGYTTLDLSGLVNMSEDERRAFADNYLAQIGMTESIEALRQEKDDFNIANPEYGQYSEYQKTVGKAEDQPGGVTAWRESLAETNPNFRQAMEEKKQELLDRGVSRKLIDYELNAWAMSQDAYFAAMGMQQGIYDEKPGDVYDPGSDPLNNPALAGMRPPVETVESGGGSGGDAEETGKPEKEWTLYKGDTVEKGSAHAIQLAEHETLGNAYLANQAAEALYGDEWDYDAVAASGEFSDGWVNKDHPRTEYYGDASPSDATMAKRYREWQRVTGSNGSIDEWLAWEAGLREGFTPPGVMSSQQVAASPAMQAAAIRLGATVPPAPQSSMSSYQYGGASFDPSKGSYGGGGGGLATMFGGTTDVSFAFGEPNDLGYYEYSTQYGMNGSDHTGIDVPQSYGSPIYAPADAEVVCVGCWQNEYDLANGQVGRIELAMPDGAHILYDHSLDSTVQDGDYVSAGQQIGANGNGNDGSPHTHLEVRVPDSTTPSGWRLIDPLPYLESIS
jgi:murein DD-endopeptidase MepM/ murein hydrolase activator NlpD